MRIEFIQPDRDGHLLAIVEFLTDKERRCDLALIRLPPAAVATLPDWHTELPSEFAPGAEGNARSIYLDTVERDPRTWKRAGYDVIEHDRSISLTQMSEQDSGRHARILDALLSHPVWLAAKVGQVLREGLGTARAGLASRRL